MVIPSTRSTPRTQSRDHILPKFRGGTLIIHGDVRNVRLMCAECNALVAQCGQCLGAMACARTVAGGTSIRALLRRWDFPRIALAMLRRDMARVDAENRAAREAALAAHREPMPAFAEVMA